MNTSVFKRITTKTTIATKKEKLIYKHICSLFFFNFESPLKKTKSKRNNLLVFR